MSKKLPLRHERDWRWQDPPKLDSGFYKHRVELLSSVGDRVNHFPGYGRDSFYEFGDDGEETPETTGVLDSRESISLASILKKVEKEGLNPKNVHVTASFSDDYLNIEVVHIRKLDEMGQHEEYQDALDAWSKVKKYEAKQEKERIEQEIQMLQQRLDGLKDKQ